MGKNGSICQKGMGLLEVMVAAAMLGGLALVVMQMNQSGQKSVTRVEKGLEAAEFDSEINSYLSDKENCTASISALGLTSASQITGSSVFPLDKRLHIMEAKSGSTPFTIPYVRNLLTLDEVYITDLGSPLIPAANARLIKKYSFKLDPTTTSTKTKSSTIAIIQDPNPPHEIIGCNLRQGDNDSAWAIDSFGIYYQNGTVAVGKRADMLVPYALDVRGQAVIGENNAIQGAATSGNSVLAGQQNTIAGASTNDSVILGGGINTVSGNRSVIIGGQGNVIATDGHRAVVLGGMNNSNNGRESVLGGEGNTIDGGAGHFAFGENIHVQGMTTMGTVAFADRGGDGTLSVSTTNQFSGRFANGYRFCINGACSTLCSINDSGSLSCSGGFIIPSSKKLKEDFRIINEEEILSRMAELELTSWVYKLQKNKTGRTIGPMAEDFHHLFAAPYGLRSTTEEISHTDLQGVALTSIKALEKRTRELKEENGFLKQKNSELEGEIQELRSLYKELIHKIDSRDKGGK